MTDSPLCRLFLRIYVGGDINFSTLIDQKKQNFRTKMKGKHNPIVNLCLKLDIYVYVYHDVYILCAGEEYIYLHTNLS